MENAEVFDWDLTASDMDSLDGLTDEDALQSFKALYCKCVVRDTPLSATGDGVKAHITLD